MFPDNHTIVSQQSLLSTPPRQEMRSIGITKHSPSIADENMNRKYNIQHDYGSPTSVSKQNKKYSPQYRLPHRGSTTHYKIHTTDNTNNNHDDDDDNESIAPLTPRSDKYHQSLFNTTSGLLLSPTSSSHSFDNSISTNITAKSSQYHNSNDTTNSTRHCTPLSPAPLPFSPSGSCSISNSNNSNHRNYSKTDSDSNSNSKTSPSSPSTTTTTRTKTTTNSSSTHSTKPRTSSKNRNNNTCILDVWANKRRILSPGTNNMNERDSNDIDNTLIINDLSFLINKERQYYNLYPLQRSSELDYLAHVHCQHMANTNTLYHSVSSSEQLQIKLSSLLVGENIQRGTSVCNIYRTMMCGTPTTSTSNNSDDDHCFTTTGSTTTNNKTNALNILSKQFTEFGSAIYIGTTDYKMYCCQFFRKVDY